jgi:hypothetical protein
MLLTWHRDSESRARRSRLPMRRANMPRAGDARGLNLEEARTLRLQMRAPRPRMGCTRVLAGACCASDAPPGTPACCHARAQEDEKESDRHRWRQQQSQNDPGAKACEATCIFCVGMLFLQVAWILYTYGVQGTMNLLMAPEEALGGGLRSTSTYLAVSPPPGYGSEVVVLHDAESGLQRTHYTVDGACRVRLGATVRGLAPCAASRACGVRARGHTCATPRALTPAAPRCQATCAW